MSRSLHFPIIIGIPTAWRGLKHNKQIWRHQFQIWNQKNMDAINLLRRRLLNFDNSHNLLYYEHDWTIPLFCKTDYTWSNVWVDTLLKAVFEYFPWQLQQICGLKSDLDLGEDNDVTREGEIMGDGVLDIRWEQAEFAVSDFLPPVGLLEGVVSEVGIALVLLVGELLLVEWRTGFITVLR